MAKLTLGQSVLLRGRRHLRDSQKTYPPCGQAAAKLPPAQVEQMRRARLEAGEAETISFSPGTTPESWKGLPEVISLRRQLSSKVNTVPRNSFIWKNHFHQSGLVRACLHSSRLHPHFCGVMGRINRWRWRRGGGGVASFSPGNHPACERRGSNLKVVKDFNLKVKIMIWP